MGGIVDLPGSFRPPPDNQGDPPRAEARVRVVLHLMHPDEARHPPGSAEDFADLARPVSRSALARKRGRDFAPARPLLAEFARRHGLKLGRVRPMLRTARLEGTAAQIAAAFGMNLHCKDDDLRTLTRSGGIALSGELAPWIRAVLGFAGKPLRPASAAGNSTAASGLWPRQIAALYSVPADARADGQCIGIIAPGGSYRAEDLQAAAAQSGVPVPDVFPPPDGDVFGRDATADKELALDLQVALGAAPGAKLLIYSAAQSDEGMVDALHAAISDSANAPHVISLSWSSAEDAWHDDTRAALDASLQDAVRLRIAVVVAAGDNLATGGMLDGKAHVYYPASSPYVLACGGSAPQLDASNAAIVSESVWNDTFYGTGGGISETYPVPDYQAGLGLPANVNPGTGPGRGVPDVAAAAWSDPGYAIIVGGTRSAEPGTSAATPFWAALLALANARRDTPLGLPHHVLYANANLFRTVLTGDNKDRGIGYGAGAPWNACTGLGVPNAGDVIQALG